MRLIHIVRECNALLCVRTIYLYDHSVHWLQDTSVNKYSLVDSSKQNNDREAVEI